MCYRDLKTGVQSKRLTCDTSFLTGIKLSTANDLPTRIPEEAKIQKKNAV